MNHNAPAQLASSGVSDELLAPAQQPNGVGPPPTPLLLAPKGDMGDGRAIVRRGLDGLAPKAILTLDSVLSHGTSRDRTNVALAIVEHLTPKAAQVTAVQVTVSISALGHLLADAKRTVIEGHATEVEPR